MLLAAVTDDPESGRTAVFALNRSPTETLEAEIDLRGFGDGPTIEEALELHHPNLKAANTKAAPDTVVPRRNGDVSVRGSGILAKLKPLSWNLIVVSSLYDAAR